MCSHLLVIKWHSCGRSRSQQEITAIYLNTLQMLCAVLISVIFCSSIAGGWPGRNQKLWSNPYLVAHNAAIITGTVFVLTFHILLTFISRSLYLLSFSVSFVLMFKSSCMAVSISRQICFLSCSTVSGWFACLVRSVITCTSHVIMIPLTYMTLSGMCS